MYKSALLALKPSAAQDYVIGFAVDLARRHRWHLASCTVVDVNRIAHAEPVPMGASAFKKHKDEQLIASAREGAKQAADKLQIACATAGVDCQVLIGEGDIVQTIARRGQQHDLLLLGHSGGDDTGDESLLYNIVKHSARPVLMFPRQPPPGTNVVVAYDGSMQAARSLASLVYSGLSSGGEVHVVSCHADGKAAVEVNRDACQFLKWHGIDAVGHAEHLAGPVAKTLLELAVQYQAGLMVMGAFGKSWARDFFLGSITREILHQLPFPILMDH
jgi:nucleotide-binding universal stress UspA family protein